MHSQKKQDRMTSEQSMIQAIMQAAIEATKVAIMTVKKTEIPVNTAKAVSIVTKRDRLVLKQPMFD